MAMTFRLILFDLDDTLCDYAGARVVRLRTAFSRATASLPPDALDLDRLIAESIAIHPHGIDHFPALLARYGVADADSVTAAQTWYRVNRFYGLALFPDALETLTRTRSVRLGRKVGLVTNGPAEVQRAKIELLGLTDHVDFALVSGEFGAAKPDPAIFVEALRLGDALPHETLFIGDSPEFDIAGAKASGLTAVWVNRTGRPWSEPGEPPDYEVTDLTALAALLAGLDGER
jgi:putative hydrolase of the HAD superfamily